MQDTCKQLISSSIISPLFSSAFRPSQFCQTKFCYVCLHSPRRSLSVHVYPPKQRAVLCCAFICLLLYVCLTACRGLHGNSSCLQACMNRRCTHGLPPACATSLVADQAIPDTAASLLVVPSLLVKTCTCITQHAGRQTARSAAVPCSKPAGDSCWQGAPRAACTPCPHETALPALARYSSSHSSRLPIHLATMTRSLPLALALVCLLAGAASPAAARSLRQASTASAYASASAAGAASASAQARAGEQEARGRGWRV